MLWYDLAWMDPQFLTAGRDNSVRLWDTNTGIAVATLLGHATVYKAAFNNDGSRVITAFGDNTAEWLDVATGTVVSKLHFTGVVEAFSPDASRVITRGGNSPRLWDTTTGAALATLWGILLSLWIRSSAPMVLA